MDNQKSEIIQICGLWLNETKDGQSKFLKGNCGQVQYLVFRNKSKTAANHPDYHLCITKNNTQKKDEGAFDTALEHKKNPRLGIPPESPFSDPLPHRDENIGYDLEDQNIPF